MFKEQECTEIDDLLADLNDSENKYYLGDQEYFLGMRLITIPSIH